MNIVFISFQITLIICFQIKATTSKELFCIACQRHATFLCIYCKYYKMVNTYNPFRYFKNIQLIFKWFIINGVNICILGIFNVLH